MVALLTAILASLGLFSPPAAAEIRPDQQWYLDAMEAPELWKVTKGEGVTVAVIDSGVKPVPGLEDRLLPGKSFSPAASDPHEDTDGHGTEMASLIAGSGTAGSLQGLAPEAKILPLRTHQSFSFSVSWSKRIAEAIRYAVDNGAKVINVSQGKRSLSEDEFTRIQNAVNYANRQGALIFAASGNDGRRVEKDDYPAVLPGVVAVGAVDETGTVADFSNYGPHLVLSAPGDPGGTSVATALTSATAALIWSKHPDWTNHQVLRVMVETAGRSEKSNEPSMYLGYGTLRPGQVIIDGKGDPGPADKSPVFSEYFASLEASQSPSPESGSADDKNQTDQRSQEEQEQSPSGSGEDQNTAQADNDGPPWTAIGIGAAVLALAATVTIVAVRRRNQARQQLRY
ncbi:S8 family serine peptidase [Streptomyces taklimakanensis]|uniref:S8 family serine peptidase n=1 Tax=Streptomyces taklimakanensis TaxID=2569853 RepID=UPI001390B9A6